jgi:hypothetical protein
MREQETSRVGAAKQNAMKTIQTDLSLWVIIVEVLASD